MLRSLSLVLNFVMKTPDADNALSDSMDVDATVFKSINEKTNISGLFSSYLKNLKLFLKVFHIIIIQWFGFFQSQLI